MNETSQYIILSKLQSVFDEISLLRNQVDTYKQWAIHAERRQKNSQNSLVP